jgi:hypothetical protein
MTRYIYENGIERAATAEEETAFDAEETQDVKDKKVINDAKTAEIAKKTSGKQKLKDLGLDDDEIKALTGK